MAATVRIWDPFVRVFHWSLVASFALAWLTGDEIKSLHIWAGYAAGALIMLRLVWGVVGTRYARFAQFIRSPVTVAAYLRDVITGREARYLGHNPVGGLMIVALIAAMSVVCVTGWMQTTDAGWGVEWVEEAHEAMASAMLGLVGLHVLGVVVTSLRHRENLVRAMLTGRKRSPAIGDVA
jgi:cytochrome b